jgi:hypothetical protein
MAPICWFCMSLCFSIRIMAHASCDACIRLSSHLDIAGTTLQSLTIMHSLQPPECQVPPTAGCKFASLTAGCKFAISCEPSVPDCWMQVFNCISLSIIHLVVQAPCCTEFRMHGHLMYGHCMQCMDTASKQTRGEAAGRTPMCGRPVMDTVLYGNASVVRRVISLTLGFGVLGIRKA